MKPRSFSRPVYKMVVLLCCASLLAFGPVKAAPGISDRDPNPGLELLAKVAGTPPSWFQTWNNKLLAYYDVDYYTNESRIEIYEYLPTHQLQKVGEIGFVDSVTNLGVTDNALYALVYNTRTSQKTEIDIVNWQDPKNPVFVNVLDDVPYIYLLVYQQFLIAFYDQGDDQLSADIYSLSDPYHPALLGAVTLPGSWKSGDPFVGGGKILGAYANHLYYVSYSTDTLYAVNISDPFQPVRAGTYPFSNFDNVPAATLRDGYAYVVTYLFDGCGLFACAESYFLDVISLTDPGAMTQVGSALLEDNSTGSLEDFLGGLEASNGYVYLLAGFSTYVPKLKVYQMEPTGDITQVNELSLSISVFDLGQAPGVLFVGTDSGLEARDTTHPVDLPLIATSLWLGIPGNVDVDAPYAYVWDNSVSDLKVLDFSNEAAPFIRYSIPTAQWVEELQGTDGYMLDLQVSGDYMYLLKCMAPQNNSYNYSLDLEVISLNGLPDLTPTSVYTATNSLECQLMPRLKIADKDGLAFIYWRGTVSPGSCSNGGLETVDIADPMHPVQVNSFDGTWCFSDLALAGNLLYVISQVSNTVSVLLIYNLTDRANPTLLREPYVISIGLNSIALKDNYAVLGGQELAVVDIHDPAHPTIRNTLDRPASNILWRGRYLYVVNGFYYPDNGLQIFDMANPLNPALSAVDPKISVSQLGDYSNRSLALYEDKIYVANGTTDLFVLRQNGMLPEPVELTLTPGISQTLVYSDTYQRQVSLDFPALAISSPLTVTAIAVWEAGLLDQSFAGIAFELQASQGGVTLPAYTFTPPITVTLVYNGSDVWTISDPAALTLKFATPEGWVEALDTCPTPGNYTRKLAENRLSLPICKTGRYALFGPTHRQFIPYLPME
jgi:hypothetical protein